MGATSGDTQQFAWCLGQDSRLKTSRTPRVLLLSRSHGMRRQTDRSRGGASANDGRNPLDGQREGGAITSTIFTIDFHLLLLSHPSFSKHRHLDSIELHTSRITQHQHAHGAHGFEQQSFALLIKELLPPFASINPRFFVTASFAPLTSSSVRVHLLVATGAQLTTQKC